MMSSRCDEQSMISRAFTLIELMIVVVILGILSALVIPMLAQQLSKESELATEAEQASFKQEKEEASHSAYEPQSSIKLPGHSPQLRALKAKIDLQAGHRLDGLQVHTWYEASFEGIFEFRVPEEGLIKLEFPFPAGSVGAQDVSLELLSLEGGFEEPKGVIYDLRGIYWSGMLPPERSLQAQVSYRAEGYDRFLFQLPGEGRTASLDLELNIEGVTPHIPGTTLQPQLQEPGHLRWHFENLVTQNREILVELPAVLSPIGRVILLAKLASLGVLLFGIGFWYMSEAWKPGCLDSFRWGDFLLLSLSYFLFFILFAVLMFRYQLSAPLGLGAAALLSIPLLLLHVSVNLKEHLGPRFALMQVLPLALFTLALVVNGVYGAQLREYLYLGAAVIAMAYFTLSYRGWATGRQRRRAQREWRWLQDVKQQQAQRSLEELRQLRLKAEQALRELERGPRGLNAWGETEALKLLLEQSTLPALERSLESLSLLEEPDSEEYEQQIRQLLSKLQAPQEELKRLSAQAYKRVAQLESVAAKLQEQQRASRAEWLEHLRAAWTALQSLSGEVELLEMEAEAASLGADPELSGGNLDALQQHRAELQRWLLEMEKIPAQLNTLESEAPGSNIEESSRRLLRQLKGLSKRLSLSQESLQGTLKILQEQHKRLEYQKISVQEEQRCCLSCGKRVFDGEFCSHCGAQQAKVLHCNHCQGHYRLPLYLIPLWPPAEPLHCPSCGQVYESL